MGAPNGHTEQATTHLPAPLLDMSPGIIQFDVKRARELVAALEVPFDRSQIDWRVMNTTKNQQPVRGQVVPYADQRCKTSTKTMTCSRQWHAN
jgi:hypothetical protein